MAKKHADFDPQDIYAGADEAETEAPSELDLGNELPEDWEDDGSSDDPEQFGDLGDLSDLGGPTDDPGVEDEEPAEEESVEEEPVEEEPVEEEPVEEEPAPKREDRDVRVPKFRLDQEAAKRREAEKLAKQLQQELAKARAEAAKREQVSEEQIQAWLKESAQKTADGDFDEAVALQQKAMKAMSQRADAPAAIEVPDIDTLVAQVEERTELKFTVKQVFADYPVFNPDSDQFDADLSNEAVEYQDLFIAKGYTAPQAVERAARLVATMHGLNAASAAPAKPKPPVRDTRPQPEKKQAVARQQPAQPAGRRGNKAAPEETVDISQLDAEAYAALPAEVRARLRGDII